MKNKGLLILIPVVLSIFTIGFVGCDSCGGGNIWSDCIDDYGMPKDVNGALASYYHVTVANEIEITPGCDVYVDYSDGIGCAWSSSGNKDVLLGLLDACMSLSSGAQYFPLYNDLIQPAQDFKSRQAADEISDAKNYVQAAAPIDKAMDKIVNGSKQGVLITDMELYGPPVGGSAQIVTATWADKYMKLWLEKGNSIEVRFSNQGRYTDTKIKPAAPKNLYFIFFIPKGITEQQSAYTNFMTKVGTKTNGFSLNPQPSKVSNEYGGVERTGMNPLIDPADGSVKIVNANLKDKLNYEFIDHTGLNWDYINNMLTEGSLKKSDVFRKLYLDLSNTATYSIDEIDVEVYDITEDFTKFGKWNCVKDLKPAMTKDGNQSDVWAESVSELERMVFNENTQILKDEFKYVPGKGVKLDEIFEINKQLFQNGLSQSRAKVEVGLDFHSNFNYEKFKEHANGIIRIDIVVKTNSWNSLNPVLSELEWTGTGGNNFKEAITNLGTLNSFDDCKPTGAKHKILYTYFLKMLPNE